MTRSDKSYKEIDLFTFGFSNPSWCLCSVALLKKKKNFFSKFFKLQLCRGTIIERTRNLFLKLKRLEKVYQRIYRKLDILKCLFYLHALKSIDKWWKILGQQWPGLEACFILLGTFEFTVQILVYGNILVRFCHRKSLIPKGQSIGYSPHTSNGQKHRFTFDVCKSKTFVMFWIEWERV